MTTITVDHGSIQAIKHYVIYGLDPGSFGRAVILGDYDLARKKAHALLLRLSNLNPENDIIRNMIDWVEVTLPDFMRSSEENFEEWKSHSGLQGASDEIKLFMKLNPFKNMDDWYYSI